EHRPRWPEVALTPTGEKPDSRDNKRNDNGDAEEVLELGFRFEALARGLTDVVTHALSVLVAEVLRVDFDDPILPVVDRTRCALAHARECPVDALAHLRDQL